RWKEAGRPAGNGRVPERPGDPLPTHTMPRSSHPATRALLLAVVLLAAFHPSHAGAPGGWNRFQMLVWQYRTPPPGPEAKRLYESVNLHGIHLDNGFPDALFQFAKENGYPYYVDHTAGKG